jgi:hypothetical protein
MSSIDMPFACCQICMPVKTNLATSHPRMEAVTIQPDLLCGSQNSAALSGPRFTLGSVQRQKSPTNPRTVKNGKASNR